MSLHDILKIWRERPKADAACATDAANDAAAAGFLRVGVAQLEQAQYADALENLTRAIDLKYDLAEAHRHLGLAYLKQSKLEDALDSLYMAAHFAPRSAAAHMDLGAALAQLQRHDDAARAYAAALELEPQSAVAWLRLGNIEKQRGDMERATAFYRNAIEEDARLQDAHCQLAFVLYKVGAYAESREAHAAALAVNPEFAEVHHNLGLLLLETGYAEEALASFTRALALRPESPATRACVAHALRELGRLDEALDHYDALLAEQPDFGDAVINRCYTLLMREHYGEGWQQYERRFVATGTPLRGFPYAQWHGQPLADKRMLVYAEQGLGDEIMFASCIPDVLHRCRDVVIECNTRLEPLYKRSFPAAVVRGAEKNEDKAWLAQLPRIDFQVAVGSLPLHFRRSRAQFPAHQGYLIADPQRVAKWRSRLGTSAARLRVGIAWRGGSLRTKQATRSIPLERWVPLLGCRDIEFVGLQYGETARELASLCSAHQVTVRHLGDSLADFDELAAAIETLDLVITVDNTVAHLAGALGREVWILLANAPEWRYPRHGTEMPWYPSARLFRQTQSRAWEPVMVDVMAALGSAGARHQV